MYHVRQSRYELYTYFFKSKIICLFFIYVAIHSFIHF